MHITTNDLCAVTKPTHARGCLSTYTEHNKRQRDSKRDVIVFEVLKLVSQNGNYFRKHTHTYDYTCVYV